MKNEKSWKKRNARYDEIPLPLTKIIKTGGCLAIIIKKDMAERYKLNSGDQVIPTLLRRKHKLSDEMRITDIKSFLKDVDEYYEEEQQDVEYRKAAKKLLKEEFSSNE